MIRHPNSPFTISTNSHAEGSGQSIMPIVRFIGRVLPAKHKVSLPSEPTFQWKIDHLALEVTFRLRIDDGSVLIACDVNKFVADIHLLPLFVRAYDIASASVDLVAFASGRGLRVVLETFIDPAGATVPIAAEQPSLAALATAMKLEPRDFEKILQIVLAEPALMMALQDLTEAVLLPHRAAFKCARAMRSLGWVLMPPKGDSGPEWLALREKLQITKSYLQRITQFPRFSDSG